MIEPLMMTICIFLIMFLVFSDSLLNGKFRILIPTFYTLIFIAVVLSYAYQISGVDTFPNLSISAVCCLVMWYKYHNHNPNDDNNA
ncbi:hypothetical protein BG262_03790 [Floricoccus penangensis]|uniref:Uncharacterized protein n=1 Tax=Floricoccus penangensis TaxID=1859475 RepID=A0A9Q5JH78_9LACT|nr:hypothetical protein [Floricoccus penangensis]OFI46921.1 hypothetical protein BG262_03790 [Floricoccus penangensis]